MKILVVSKYGDILALMHRVMVEEGIDVIAYIDNENSKKLYDGLLDKVNTFQDLLKQATKDDIIYFDFTGFGDAGYELQKRGYKVFGGWKLADKLEQRDYAYKINQRFNINQPDTHLFNDITSAIEFIEKNKKLYVVKTNAEYPITTFVPDKHYEETMIYLESLANEKVQSIELQEKLNGIEVTLTLRFNKGMIIPALMDSTIEEKRFLTGNLGVNTGCVSSVVLPYKTPPQMFKEIVNNEWLQYIEDFQYTGYIDINTMYMPEENKYYFLEYTPRSGYNYEYAYKELLNVPYHHYLMQIITGDISISLKDSIAGALRVSTPPEPLESKEIEKIYKNKYFSFGIKDIKTNVYFINAFVENEMLYSALPVFVEVCAYGKTIDEIEKIIFDQVDNLILPFKQYRIDAFNRAKKDIDIIKKVNII